MRVVTGSTVPHTAVTAYTAAIRLLPLLAWWGIDGHDQWSLLHAYAGDLVPNGAAAALAKRPGPATELLETGRGVYWSQLLNTRTDLRALAERAPEPAARLAACRARLEGVPNLDQNPATVRRTRSDRG
ncbi:hypothetical protein FHR83_008336 [Actinoplanes campanulatus]|uniref:Uncharacterized protein n=1 Tax=Actinoplanes campanulatus TaxID=113559 RepID=A0A7W5AQQ5_9ACTN|nr:hypothetical protein [Actinoplanes campanulatus]MBB3100611.1 hypothetical protein [Actinoplanes campanulatus]GGN45871.1 hypothetical protein GCM10010109_80510 [Actinoplanes campanulatus]GID41070.1 hypothetical protein Aca09nite_75760 [Actinoplanes campanulatus]